MVLAHNINEGQRTKDVQIKEDVTFESILLANDTLRGLKKAGFYKPSPIQLHGIPLGKCGFDLLLEAKSGTGKTAVFTVIALEKLDLRNGLQVIMLAPTREIAAQICHVIKEIGSNYSGLNVEVVMGGLPVQEDILKFSSKLVHIVVGSPGRLKHLILDKHIDVSSVRLLVLDECDKLVEKSFLADINTIFSILPKQKQVIMSSATYPEKCKKFISKYVNNAQHICPDSSTVLLGITQRVTVVKYNNNIVKKTQNRFEELLKIITTKPFKQCLIFCNYQARVAELHKMLIREKWPAELLYGQQDQNDRLDALKTLQEYKCRILISTDLAARGIDASNVDLIINFEPPLEWQTYLHRIGRAGRYGTFGTAVTILSEGKEVTNFKDIFESINLSLDLRNLWTDDEFSTQSISSYSTDVPIPDFIQPEKEITPDQLSKELWDILSSENGKDPEVIETFEELQNSYENICSHNNNIESFTDLLKQSDDEGFGKFKCISSSKIPIRYYLKYIQNEYNVLKDSESSCKPFSYYSIQSIPSVKTEMEVPETHNTNSLQPNKDMNDKSHCKHSPNIEDHKINISQYQYNEEYISTHKNTSSSNYGHSQINTKALLEAGLPTSFGRNDSKYRSVRKSPNKEETLGKEHLDTTEDTPFSTSKLQSHNKRNMGSTSRPKHYKKNCNSLNRSTSYNNLRDLNYTNSHAKQNKSEKVLDNYEMWFNQLKMHIKYIEYVIYNDEMCKF